MRWRSSCLLVKRALKTKARMEVEMVREAEVEGGSLRRSWMC